MRLLHTLSLKLEEFFDNNIPPYAILSHRWEKGEVSLQDLVSGRGRWKQGYAKIQSCCDRASRDGLEYVWIDTCCIDKSSSAELSEAINSMFQWYRSAFICYAYLSDVTAGFEVGASFRLSQWFTRGWTLQELLAPDWVLFFDKDWKDLGTKSSLSSLISSITGINHLLNFKEASVAQKMSWAAKRETTRVEDQAYSLMGLFDVNMPTIYGEGKRAFIRLQLEIIKNSSDESIFAWSQSPRISRLSYHSSMLAPSPSYFRRSSLVKICSIDNQHSPNTMTNMGLRI
ncbi:heterokaryon incompatibility protein-domain-containing protein, partial [Halenospora varia]